MEVPDPEIPAPPVKRISTMLVILAVMVASTLWLALARDPEELLQQGLHLRAKSPAASERLFRRALEIRSGDYPDAQLALTELMIRLDQRDEAEKLFSALDRTRCRSNLLLMLGRGAYFGDLPKMAWESLESVPITDSADSISARSLLIKVYRENGRQEEFLRLLRNVIHEQPGDAETGLLLVSELKSMGLESECLEVCREILAHDPPADLRVELQFQLIDQLTVVGKCEAAWQEVAELDRTIGPSVRREANKVDLYRLDGRLAEAMAIIDTIFAEFQHLPAAYLARGSVYLDQGNYASAAADFEKLLKMQPFLEGAHFKLSEALRGLGRSSQSQQHRVQGTAIRDKRYRINELLRQNADAPSDSIMDELATLYAQIGEKPSSDLWLNRAGRSHKEKGR